ncbi:MTRF1L release factor glutamine methyltransferase isoform X2 [Dromiciops gliroides]|uniref:MTRF1L release factor glutamine methyltransferase isoform X2 n=1 Tax=Dromiciops gliroides TaxID=33562 RepID=UPI001CC580C3|nr:MTRF1L release factor glutamine methyltransferase isoform X2 [Dromiciops gliroides]
MWLWRMKPWILGPRGVKWKGGLYWASLRPVSGCRALLVTATALVNHWTQLFEERGVPEARESSEYIVAHVLGAKTFQSLPASQRSTPITKLQQEQIGELCARRLQRMPVQYVIGEWDFQGLTLKMAPPVFIPRPETEELVNLVLHEESQRWQEPRGKGTLGHQPRSYPLILDVCCGSGAIALSLLSRLTQSRVVAVDKGEEAVRLTRENAQRLHLENRIQIVHHDVTAGVNREQLLVWGPVDFLVSNPPYIFHRDMEQLAPEILSYEDTDSLDGGEDGMRVITEILSQAPVLLKDSGSIFLEVDPRHPELVGKWLQSCPDLGLSISATHVDFCGKPRFLHIRKSRGSGS